jgi:hypothetical protein
MWLRRRLVLLGTIITLLGGTVAAIVAIPPAASAAAATGDGWVRCANLSPGTPTVDIYLYSFSNPGHPIVLKHAEYGEVYSYMPVSAGQYTVAMRPVGASASSPPAVSTSFMVSPGSNYTVASIGPATGRRLEVLMDQVTAPAGRTLVRVLQASVKQPLVTVSDGRNILARQLAFSSVTSYLALQPGTQTVQFSAPGEHTAKSVTLAAGSVHTIVVLDDPAGLKVGTLTDAAGSNVTPTGGAATGMGGAAPHPDPQTAPWLATLAAGLLLVMAGLVGLRRSRRAVALVRE